MKKRNPKEKRTSLAIIAAVVIIAIIFAFIFFEKKEDKPQDIP